VNESGLVVLYGLWGGTDAQKAKVLEAIK